MNKDTKDTFSSYNPYINFIFFFGAIGLSIFLMHPAWLHISVFFSFTYLFTVRGKRAFRILAAMTLVFIAVSVVNPLFNTMGNTVLFTLFGRRPFTKEALICGMTSAMMVISVLTWFMSYSDVMTSDKFMYVFSGIIPALSLVLTMVLRLVPSYERKTKQIVTSRASVGKGETGGTVREKAEEAVTVLGSLTSWALEGAVTTADSMRSRGYGAAGKRTSFSIYRFDTRDMVLVAVMIVFIAAAVTGIASGNAFCEFYPETAIAVPGGITGTGGIICFAMFTAVPTLINVKERILWRYLISRI